MQSKLSCSIILFADQLNADIIIREGAKQGGQVPGLRSFSDFISHQMHPKGGFLDFKI